MKIAAYHFYVNLYLIFGGSGNKNTRNVNKWLLLGKVLEIKRNLRVENRVENVDNSL